MNDRSPLDAWMSGASEVTLTVSDAPPGSSVSAGDGHAVAAADGDTGLANGAELVHGDFHRVGARCDVREDVVAGGVGDGRHRPRAPGFVDEHDRRAGDDSAGAVLDGPRAPLPVVICAVAGVALTPSANKTARARSRFPVCIRSSHILETRIDCESPTHEAPPTPMMRLRDGAGNRTGSALGQTPGPLSPSEASSSEEKTETKLGLGGGRPTPAARGPWTLSPRPRDVDRRSRKCCEES